MNYYDEIYEIRIADYSDIPIIMSFIDVEWRHNHILSRDRMYFEYEYVIDGKVNFLLAKKKGTEELDGIIGFLPASKKKECLDIWTVMWKVRSGCFPLLGTELMKRVAVVTKSRYSLGIGDNPMTTVPILKKIDKSVVAKKLNHYYLLNNRERFRIARICYKPNKEHLLSEKKITARLLLEPHECQGYIDFKNFNIVPYKDLWYIAHRYFENPIYKYYVYGIKVDNDSALIVFRIQEYNNSKALRIIDYIGVQSCFGLMYDFFEQFMKKNGCEYTDFFVNGFEEKHILNAGFSRVEDDDMNIIPDYFNPFVLKNVDVWSTSQIDACMFCKGDGDQDRPC